MAKRFTDTDKWRKGWFCKLSPEMKLFWIYILDNCDSAGIWDINFELAEFQIGLKLDIDNIQQIFKKQVVRINNSKWFIIDFIEFQYKCSINDLNPQNKALIPVINAVSKYNLKGACKGLARGLNAPMDKEKEKEKDKDKEKETVKDIVDDLNLVLSTSYKPTTKTTKDFIVARLNEGFTIEDFKTVHRKMFNCWGQDEKMCKYLRPITLYSNKFESYLNMSVAAIQTKVSHKTIKSIQAAKSWTNKGEVIDVAKQE